MASCSYCLKARAANADHIVSKSMRRRYPGFDDVTVPACFACNMRKGNRRLVPMDYEPFDELPGDRPWMRWDGDPKKLSVVLR